MATEWNYNQHCFSDSDCPMRLVCYNNITWPAFKNTSKSYCYCESWWGWQGHDCLTFSSCTITEAVGHSFNLLSSLCFLIITCHELYQRMKNEKTKMNATISTLLLVLITFAFVVILESVNLFHAFSPNSYRYVNDLKQDQLFPFDALLLGAIIVLLYLVSVNLALVWINVASGGRHQKSRNTQRAGRRNPNRRFYQQPSSLKEPLSQKIANCIRGCGSSLYNLVPDVPPGLARLRYFIFTCEITFILVVIICFASSVLWLASFVTIPFIFSVCYLHIWGRRIIITELEKMRDYENFDQQAQQLQHQIENDSLQMDSGGFTNITSRSLQQHQQQQQSTNVYIRLCKPIIFTSRYIVFNIILGNICAILYSSQIIVTGQQHPEKCEEKIAVWSVMIISYICTFTCASILWFFVKSRLIFVDNKQNAQKQKNNTGNKGGPPMMYKQFSGIHTTASGAFPPFGGSVAQPNVQINNYEIGAAAAAVTKTTQIVRANGNNNYIVKGEGVDGANNDDNKKYNENYSKNENNVETEKSTAIYKSNERLLDESVQNNSSWITIDPSHKENSPQDLEQDKPAAEEETEHENKHLHGTLGSSKISITASGVESGTILAGGNEEDQENEAKGFEVALE